MVEIREIEIHKEAVGKSRMDFTDYKEKKAEAMEAFRDFIKDCAKRGFTLQQLEMIVGIARDEIPRIIGAVHEQILVTEDLCDLLVTTI